MKNLKSITIWCFIFAFIASAVYSQPQRSASNPNAQVTKEAADSVNDKSSDQEASPDSDEDGPTPLQGLHRPPTINWGKCPQLEPKEAEKKQKADIIRTCLKTITLPENITQESVEKHRTEVAKCALNAENWFTEDGNYRYDKAESEIKNKKLPADIEPQIVNQHSECRKEAEEQFPSGIAQIQLYQACMDYHISMICGIQIVGSGYSQ